MKELLIWVKERIKNNLTEFKKVKITPDTFLIPDEKGFPAINISDNGINRDLIKTQTKEILRVKIGVFQSIMRDEESSIIGAGSQKGIEELSVDIINLLKNELPGDYYYDVRVGDESPTQTLTNDFERFIVMKTIEFNYYRLK